MTASGGAAVPTKPDETDEQLPLAVPWAHALLIAGAALPLFVPVDTNLNVIATATLTVYIGCWRSVKPDPPEDSMSQKVRRGSFDWRWRSSGGAESLLTFNGLET